MAFGRVIHLYVGKFAVGNLTSQNSKDFSQFDIEFEVTRSIEWYDNEATITIYNPSPEAINFIMGSDKLHHERGKQRIAPGWLRG